VLIRSQDLNVHNSLGHFICESCVVLPISYGQLFPIYAWKVAEQAMAYSHMFRYAIAPLTVALSTRESILSLLTGIPYQNFNFLHRWLGRIIYIQSVLHTLGWTLIEGWFYQLQPASKYLPLFFVPCRSCYVESSRPSRISRLFTL